MGNTLCASRKANVTKPIQLALVVTEDIPTEIHQDELQAAIIPEGIAGPSPVVAIEPPVVVVESLQMVAVESPIEAIIEPSPVVIAERFPSTTLQSSAFIVAKPSQIGTAQRVPVTTAKTFPVVTTKPQHKVQFDIIQLIEEKTPNGFFDKRRPSSAGHVHVTDLFVKRMGMELIEHEHLRYISKKRHNVQFKPDGVCKWIPYANYPSYVVHLIWEVKCVDSKSQRKNYRVVKEQCERGQRLKRLQKHVNQDKLLFVGFAQKGNTLQLMICLGKLHAQFLAQFQRHTNELEFKNRAYEGRE